MTVIQSRLDCIDDVIPGVDIRCDLELSRKERRQWVKHFANAHVWEFGDWDAGKRGRPVDTPPDLRQQVSILQQQVAELQAARVVNNNTTTTNNNTTNNTNNINVTQNITINNFGQENTDYLPTELLRQRLFQRTDGLLKTIEDVHMNDDHPENHNIRVVAARDGTVAVRLNDAWVAQPVSYTVDRMIVKGFMLNNRGALLEGPVLSEASQLLQDQQIEWHADIGRILELGNTKKDHVVKARQRVRSMLINKCKRLPRRAIARAGNASADQEDEPGSPSAPSSPGPTSDVEGGQGGELQPGDLETTA